MNYNARTKYTIILEIINDILFSSSRCDTLCKNDKEKVAEEILNLLIRVTYFYREKRISSFVDGFTSFFSYISSL